MASSFEIFKIIEISILANCDLDIILKFLLKIVVTKNCSSFYLKQYLSVLDLEYIPEEIEGTLDSNDLFLSRYSVDATISCRESKFS